MRGRWPIAATTVTIVALLCLQWCPLWTGTIMETLSDPFVVVQVILSEKSLLGGQRDTLTFDHILSAIGTIRLPIHFHFLSLRSHLNYISLILLLLRLLQHYLPLCRPLKRAKDCSRSNFFALLNSISLSMASDSSSVAHQEKASADNEHSI